MSKYYLLAYGTGYTPEEHIYNTIIDKHPFDYMLEQALEGEFLRFVSAMSITRKQYKRFKKLAETEFPDWWLLD